MAVVNVYEQYFEAKGVFNEVPRHGALVMLIAASEQGTITYEAAVNFFPHNDEEDYAVSYDAYHSKILYSQPGRRSRKREAVLLTELQSVIDELAAELDAAVFWDRPLRDARMG